MAKRLSLDTNYKRPDVTIIDQLTQEEIMEKLKGYKLVKNIDDVPLGRHVRYFTKINGETKFRPGGILQNKANSSKYVVLMGMGSKTFSVQTNNATFYEKMEQQEYVNQIEDDYKTIMTKLTEENKQLKKISTQLLIENNKLRTSLKLPKNNLNIDTILNNLNKSKKVENKIKDEDNDNSEEENNSKKTTKQKPEKKIIVKKITTLKKSGSKTSAKKTKK